MALQGNDAALVAAQLTVAWSNLAAANPGAGGLTPHELQGRIAAIYESFRSAVSETDIPSGGYDINKLV